MLADEKGIQYTGRAWLTCRAHVTLEKAARNLDLGVQMWKGDLFLNQLSEVTGGTGLPL